MKRRLIIILFLIAITFIPSVVNAEAVNLSDYKTTNLEETLKAEDIDVDLGDYSEDGNKVTIYLFRGKGCSHCQDFLKYLGEELVKDYGDKFKLVAFETWEDSYNAELFTKVAEFRGDEASGVPYILIGNVRLQGFDNSMASKVKSAIDKEYSSSNRYDIFDEMNKEEENNKDSVSTTVIIWNLVFSLITIVTLMIFVGNKNKKLIEKIEELEKKVNSKRKAK